MSDTRVKDHFADVDDFEELLEQAESFAVEDNEIEFVEDMQEKYEKWGAEMFLSDAQKSWLEKLAEGE